MLLDTVRKTIENNSLLKYGDTVLCAVSGGADSICLLYVMQALKDEYNLSVYVANVNHMLRGEESDRDSNFVKSVCKAADVECFYREYDIKKIATERKIGEEECGRICRYEFFQEIAKKLGNAKIATAHNLNDNAETVLFRLVRGASSQGLSGIKYKRGNIIRPLLDVTREDIENFLNLKGITWCEDSTNKLPIYARNKIRLSILPMLNEVSNNSYKRIVNASQLISEDDEYLSMISEKALEECYFENYLLVDKILEHHNPIKRRLVSKILTKWNAKEISYEKVIRFLEFMTKESGKQFDINADYYAEKSYSKIYIKKRGEIKQLSTFIYQEGTLERDNWKISVEVCSCLSKKESNNTAIFDADKLNFPLKVRYRRSGDKIRVKGLNGNKKLSDIFSDSKIERQQRDNVPIIEKDEDVLYVCGLRQSELYSISNETKKYLVIKYTKER